MKMKLKISAMTKKVLIAILIVCVLFFFINRMYSRGSKHNVATPMPTPFVVTMQPDLTAMEGMESYSQYPNEKGLLEGYEGAEEEEAPEEEEHEGFEGQEEEEPMTEEFGSYREGYVGAGDGSMDGYSSARFKSDLL